MPVRNPLNGFRYAAEGVVHVYRTQRHMRFHFLMLAMVLLVSKFFGFGTGEILVLLLTVSLVVVAEMLNTAVEAIVDLVTQQYHPLAKFAKDVAAGAVLMATLNALAVGIILFPQRERLARVPDLIEIQRPELITVIVLGFVLLLSLVLVRKVSGGKGTLLRGGVLSGHTALGFFMAMTVIFTTHDTVARVGAVLLALLVAQSRVDAGIHTLREVILGGLLGTAIGYIVYYIG